MYLQKVNSPNIITKVLQSFQPSQQSKRLLKQLNQFRKNPQSIIPYLAQRKKHYSIGPDNNLLFSPNHPQKTLATLQGTKPFSQLMGFLYAKDKMKPLISNEYLQLIASQIVKHFKSFQNLSQIRMNQQLGNILRNQLNSSQQYDFVDKITCMIGIGFDKDEYQPLLSLLIDDGNHQRKNRNLLFNQNWRFVGIGTDLIDKKTELRIVVYLFTSNIKRKN